MILFESLALRRGSKLLFEQASCSIHPGQKVGITGANGTGKSSLFAMLRGELHADVGHMSMPSQWVIAHVAQETPGVDRPAIDYIMDGDAEFRRVQTALKLAEEENDGVRLAHLHDQLEAIDGYNTKPRAARLMAGLGFSTDQENAPVKSFSGGWRMRLNLAQALMCRSDLLLLDEPTNHLDLDAVIWLEQWLRSYEGTLILISHDRSFLDGVINHIMHIEHQRLSLYKGTYSEFEVRRAERLAQQQSLYERQQREMAHIRSYVDRFRAQATKARQAQSRIKAMERMELVSAALVDSPFHFSFLKSEKLPSTLLTIEKGSVGYGDRLIIDNLGLGIVEGDRIGLLGPNGAGKSTLIKLLAGTLELGQGRLTTAKDLKIGYFAQHQLEQLVEHDTPLQHIQRLDKRATEQEIRNFLGGFGFNGDRVHEAIAPFSGGEKARLVLALLVYQRPNLLLLDEPTNHLDLDMRHALSVALQGFEGAMVIVSHDRSLLESVTDKYLLVSDCKAKEFDGDMDDYIRWLDQRRAQLNSAQSSKPDLGGSENSAAARKDKKRLEAEQRKKLQPLRKEQQRLEKQMAKLTAEKESIEQNLLDTALYEAAAKDQLKQLLSRQGTLQAELDEVEEAWFDIGEQMEAATAAL